MVITSEVLAKNARINALKMVHRARASHIGSALSIIDILAVLYSQIINIEGMGANRDRFILSKGHACVALYSILAEIGIISKEDLDTYGEDFSWLMNHVSHKVPGVEFSTGSLGHGMPFAVGKAFASKYQNDNWITYVLLSDGEMAEGSNWEALMFAAHHKLENLVAVIDYNKLQSLDTVDNTLRLEPLIDKLKAFGAYVLEVDGHSHSQLARAFKEGPMGKPKFIIANTVKGKGVSFMEDRIEWHYKNPDDNQLRDALIEIESRYA